MSDKPTPSAEAVGLMAASVQALVNDERYHSATTLAAFGLAAAYPQIVADVLNHYANDLETRLRAEARSGAPAGMIASYAREFLNDWAAEVSR